jgi:hypothetical protein
MRTALLWIGVVLALTAAPGILAKSGAAASTASAKGSGSMGSAAPSAAGPGSARASGAGPRQDNSHFRDRPPPDPSRSISEQDCTKPIVADVANLKCR